jgi:hypothetical protein
MTPTQEDREAAWPYNDFHCQPDRQMRDRWFAGYYDNQPQGAIIRAFMRHRLAAEERGARMALEAAAKVADKIEGAAHVVHCVADQSEDEGDRIYYGSTNDPHRLVRQAERLLKAAIAIRQIDPASLGAE